MKVGAGNFVTRGILLLIFVTNRILFASILSPTISSISLVIFDGCWLVVELGTPREQRPGRTVERSKGESKRTKKEGEESPPYFLRF
jgi:hypothetical protein